MNRSVLLVICDFLLLSLLALARFDETGPVEQPEEIVEPQQQEDAMDADMLEMLRLSLEAEQAASDQLAQELAAKEKALQTREALLSDKNAELEAANRSIEVVKENSLKLQREQAALKRAQEQLERDKAAAVAEKERILQEKQRALSMNEELVAQNKKAIERLGDVEQQRLKMAEQVGELKQETASSAERLKFLQEELQQQKEAVSRYASAQERLEHEKRLAELEKQALTTKLEVASTETRVIQQQLVTAREDVEASRQNVEQMQQHATQLAAGVTTLAKSTDAIREEVKQIQPQSLNSIFNQFKQQRIRIEFDATREGFLGDRDLRYAVQTILVTDGTQAYAMMHIADTPFTEGRLSAVKGTLYLDGRAYRIANVGFLQTDPRVVVTAVPLELAEQAGVVPFKLARDPLRFPEAVLIDSQESYFGESEFKLLSDSERYLSMPSTVIGRLSGEFSPKRSDLVFAKTGEFMGMMVNRNYGVLIESLDDATALSIGDGFIPGPGNAILERQKERRDDLPY